MINDQNHTSRLLSFSDMSLGGRSKETTL